MMIIVNSKADWDKLTDEQRHVLLENGTEMPFTGKLLHNKEEGDYKCAACGNILFKSETKFDSGSGWPSFFDIANSDSVKVSTDNSLGMVRTEVTCANCGGHLGHLFNDGPEKMPDGSKCTGKRYCINSLALNFEKKN